MSAADDIAAVREAHRRTTYAASLDDPLVGSSDREFDAALDRLADRLAAAEAERDEARARLAIELGLLRNELEQSEAREASLRAAANARLAHGHNDTCQFVLETDEQYPCNCGHNDLVSALAASPEGE